MWVVCFPVSLARTTVKALYQCAGFKHFTNIGLDGGEGGGARGRRWKLFGTRKTRKSRRRAPGFNMLEKQIISNGRPVTGRGHVCSESVELSVMLYVHGNRRFIRDGSPGRPPRLSQSSWALTQRVYVGLPLNTISLLQQISELRGCVKVEVALPGSPVPNNHNGLCGCKATLNWTTDSFFFSLTSYKLQARWLCIY